MHGTAARDVQAIWTVYKAAGYVVGVIVIVTVPASAVAGNAAATASIAYTCARILMNATRVQATSPASSVITKGNSVQGSRRHPGSEPQQLAGISSGPRGGMGEITHLARLAPGAASGEETASHAAHRMLRTPTRTVC